MCHNDYITSSIKTHNIKKNNDESINCFLAKTRVTQINQFAIVVLLCYCMYGVKYIIRNGKTSLSSIDVKASADTVQKGRGSVSSSVGVIKFTSKDNNSGTSQLNTNKAYDMPLVSE